jgi:hypothetical protein
MKANTFTNDSAGSHVLPSLTRSPLFVSERPFTHHPPRQCHVTADGRRGVEGQCCSKLFRKSGCGGEECDSPWEQSEVRFRVPENMQVVPDTDPSLDSSESRTSTTVGDSGASRNCVKVIECGDSSVIVPTRTWRIEMSCAPRDPRLLVSLQQSIPKIARSRSCSGAVCALYSTTSCMVSATQWSAPPQQIESSKGAPYRARKQVLSSECSAIFGVSRPYAYRAAARRFSSRQKSFSFDRSPLTGSPMCAINFSTRYIDSVYDCVRGLRTVMPPLGVLLSWRNH